MPSTTSFAKGSETIALRIVFSELRRRVPVHPPDRKMSKLEILRAAIRYISILEYCLGMRKTPLGVRLHKEDGGGGPKLHRCAHLGIICPSTFLPHIRSDDDDQLVRLIRTFLQDDKRSLIPLLSLGNE
uniref:BHLH domain-containing protein n=1 Tax=Globodera rostochiensis TaxID=31243 RepID=A0A914HXC0_GLORO